MDLLKLGTRRSLLAWAQSGWVARRIEALNPGLRVELVGIDTRGDKIQDVPLQSVEGKEFFVAELDDALRSGRVDLTVHSLKDLSLERPVEFVCAAIPTRANPRDVVLFGPWTGEKLRQGRALKIGTSSPRRLENIPAFLSRALPRATPAPHPLEFVEIRGNVNTRLARVHELEGAPKQLDGVVLAFAGLIRLWQDEQARPELTRLLEGVRWMVLPLRECPAAPGQGALAVECRAEAALVRTALSKLHDPITASHVARERSLLAEWGGGCHQKFGATVVANPELNELLYVRGKRPDGVFVDKLDWMRPARPVAAVAWDGATHKAKAQSVSAPAKIGGAVFVANARALPEGAQVDRAWVSGTSTWFKLALRGIWVEGSAENLGFERLIETLKEPVLRLPALETWTALTHEGAEVGWEKTQVKATYRLEGAPIDERALGQATHLFWSSPAQYERWGSRARADAVHACGAGKTANRLRALGLKPLVFPDGEEWRRWVGITKS